MELRGLNYFLMAAREENITKAAKLLHITQPTLSRQLMQLEEELGVKLFKRSNHNIILTDEGMLLKRRAQEFAVLEEKTKKEFQLQNNIGGEIIIGSGEFQSFCFLSSILASFCKEYPQVRFEIYSGNADSIKNRIEEGFLDLGLMSEPVNIRKYEFVRIPTKETWGLLVHEDSDLGNKECVTPEDVAGQPIIVSQRALVQHELANWMGVEVDQINIIATYNLLYNAAIMVQNKMGAAFCIQLDRQYEHLRFIPISPELVTSSVLVWKKNQAVSATARVFLEYVKRHIAGFSAEGV